MDNWVICWRVYKMHEEVSLNNKFTSWLLLTLAIAIGSGCATSSQDKTGDELQSVPAIARPQPITATSDPIDVESEDSSETDGTTGLSVQTKESPDWDIEDFEQGFCADDIYGQYLTNQYRSLYPEQMQTRKIKVVSTTKKRGKIKKKVVTYKKNEGEYQALLYASTRMNGKTDSYFGAIPVVVNQDVYYWIHYFKTSGRKVFLKWMMRGESLRQIVQPVLQDQGIPIEFFYLAMIESGFNHGAKSVAQAEGTWQFMKGTAKLYGLKINRFVDERRDPIKSTMAAANYLKDLYADLGDWYLAMAAYNAGPGRIRGAMKRTGQSTYWELAETPHLPYETKQYVPKVLAALLLASEAKANGFDVQANSGDILPDSEVNIKTPVKLDDLALHLGISLQSLKKWNPELIGHTTPPKQEGGYSLRLPAIYAIAWKDVESQIQSVSVNDGKIHIVKRGETLARIARRYAISLKDLKAANPGLVAHKLKPGVSITIPSPGMASKTTTADNAG